MPETSNMAPGGSMDSFDKDDRYGGSEGGDGGRRSGGRTREASPFRRRGRRKVCRFCADPGLPIDYKDQKTLRLFVSETGKMIPRRISGNCARHQRPLAIAIKRARQLALLPFTGQGL